MSLARRHLLMNHDQNDRAEGQLKRIPHKSKQPRMEAELRPRRILTDQLAMSLGMSGKLAESRSVLDAAIASDPDYPLNYYNLACVAELGHDYDANTLHLYK